MNPDPSICLRCAGPVSEITRRCTRCGAERFAPRQRYAFGFAPPPGAARRSPSLGMRVGQGVALAACLLIALGASPGPLPDRSGLSPGVRASWEQGYRMGAVGGQLLAVLLMSALFLAWSRRTRPYIPFLMLALSLMGQVSRAAEGANRARAAEMDEQVAGLRETTTAFADSNALPAAASDVGAPPADANAKDVWLLRRYFAELLRHDSAVAARNGMRRLQDTLWNNARYVAAAGAHPEVERYWQAARDYTVEMRTTLPAWTDSAVRALGREAGMSRLQIDEEARAAAASSPERWRLQEELAAAALAYHRYLVSIDGHVSYSARRDRALFDRQDELDRANLLEQRMQAAAREFTAYMERGRRDLAAMPESFQANVP